MKPNSTWYANSQRIRILMMSVISGHEISKRKIYSKCKLIESDRFVEEQIMQLGNRK